MKKSGFVIKRKKCKCGRWVYFKIEPERVCPLYCKFKGLNDKKEKPFSDRKLEQLYQKAIASIKASGCKIYLYGNGTRTVKGKDSV
jgi:hypothetical protein